MFGRGPKRTSSASAYAGEPIRTPPAPEYLHPVTSYCKKCEKAVVVDLVANVKLLNARRPGRAEVFIDATCPECRRAIYTVSFGCNVEQGAEAD